jgi:hypothetical protein
MAIADRRIAWIRDWRVIRMGEQFPAALVLFTMTEMVRIRNGRIAPGMQKVIGRGLFGTKSSLGKRLCGAEGEAVGYGGELVAAANFVGTEAGLEDAADGGDEGAAASEEDAVDGVGVDAGSLEEGVDGALDGVQVVGYP